MKTANFPERKRLRQIGALERLSDFTAGKRSNKEEIEFLKDAVATSKRGIRTKKDRFGPGARFRTA